MTAVIQRYSESKSVTVYASTDLSEEISHQSYAGGLVLIPNGSGITSLKFDVSDASGGTFERLYDKSNAEVSITVAVDRAYPLPDELFGAASFKLVTNNITSDETIKIFLKA
jgi:hypothetical protein